MRENKNSLLIGAVARERGLPVHYEADDSTAVTALTINNEVRSIITPQSVLQRVHEAALHGNFSDAKRQRRVYRGIRDEVMQIVEDCRVHLKGWPKLWPHGTPASIAGPCVEYIERELEHAAADEGKPGRQYPVFATRLRAAAVLAPIRMEGTVHEVMRLMPTRLERNFAVELLGLIARGHEGKAAQMLQAAFFPPEPETEEQARGRGPGAGRKPGTRSGPKQPPMEVIELPHTVAIKEATVGTRIAKSGARLYRPALRKPVLPSRLFVRRAPMQPGGTILIDASGSMGDWDEVVRWCESSPFATVAYYCGMYGKGWLYVYARNGRKAAHIVRPNGRNNVVDGPAMTWLLKQSAPRTMVTDRQFCGADDSDAQRVRLLNLERLGQIQVADYSKK